MKFGANINSLSIPQWKAYNLDYNDLKSKIKHLTKPEINSDDDSDLPCTQKRPYGGQRRPNVTLKSLRNAFLDNFNNVDLFINTKIGELERKLQYFQKVLIKIQAGTSLGTTVNRLSTNFVVDQQIRINELQYQALELTRVVRDLNRFSIIQKIACNKIFKKFTKYYPQRSVAEAMVLELKKGLFANPDLFVNLDLTNLTLELTYFIDLAAEELRRLKDESTGRRRSKNSLFSNHLFLLTSPVLTTEASGNGHRELSAMDMSQKSVLRNPVFKGARFDLEITFKKNFKIDCLVADNHKLTELLLNIKVLLGCEEWTEQSIPRLNLFLLLNLFKLNVTNVTTAANSNLMQFTYLCRTESTRPLPEEPLFVVSQHGLSQSIIVSHVGGLRKYAYCILPNYVVQMLFDYLLDRENPSKAKVFGDWFKENGITPLLKMALDCILNKNLVPKLKLICKRSRYLIHKEHSDKGKDENESEDISNAESSQIHDGQISESSIVSRKYEDDFLLCLDQDIFTTNDQILVQNINFDPNLEDFDKDPTSFHKYFNNDTWDRFPFHHISINLNDLNLSNFKRDMNVNPLTEVVCHDTTLENPNQRSLKKLPLKIIQLIQLNSVRLFNGDLNFYHYMLLCYYNIVPPEQYLNNHYLNLLTLNLLKQNEDVGALKQVNRIHDRLYEKKTRQVLRLQLSLKLIKLYSASHQNMYTKPAKLQENSQFHQEPYTYQKAMKVHKQEIEFLKNNVNQNYGLVDLMNTYGQLSWPDEGLFEKFVHVFTTYKNKVLHGGNRGYDIEQRIESFYDDQEDEADAHVDIERTSLLSLLTVNSHDKLNTLRGKYEQQYMSNYDDVLSVIYFSLFCISLFISGIIMGIVYSVVELSNEESQFLIEDNLALVFIIVVGLLLSLIFSMISINLNLLRYSQGPNWHTYVVWAGTSCVAFSIIWSLILLFG